MKQIIATNECLATVIDITWERIFVTLKVKIENLTGDVSKPIIFYLVDDEGTVGARFKQTVENNIYSLTLNITNQGECKCIPAGNYGLVATRDKDTIAVCETGIELIPRLQDCSRGFLYGAQKKVFEVSFFVTEDADTLPFRVIVLPASKTGVGQPKEGVLYVKRKGLVDTVKDKRKPYLRHLYKRYRKHIDHNKKSVLFISEQADHLGANQIAVINRMKERGLDKEFEIITSARPASYMSQTIPSWKTLIKTLASANTIVVDDYVPALDFINLDDDVKVIQLWHAGAGFKSSGYSRWGHMGCPAPYSAHRQYDFGIAGSKAIRMFFSEVWGINDEQVLPTGMPRMDEYLDENHKKEKLEELYNEYPMCKGKKVILFAPTYRGRNRRGAHYPYELIDFKGLREVCGEEYVVLFKMHPWVPTSVPIPKEYEDTFVDVGRYPNINDLFYFTDLLITDYSSNIFEYSLMGNPMLFFAYDKFQYGFSRGFHRAYEESAPGKVVYTFDELLKAISSKDFEDWKVKEYVDHHFDYIDSNSSDRVIDWLIRGELPNDVKDELKQVEMANKAMKSIKFTIVDDEAVEEENI